MHCVKLKDQATNASKLIGEQGAECGLVLVQAVRIRGERKGADVCYDAEGQRRRSFNEDAVGGVGI